MLSFKGKDFTYSIEEREIFFNKILASLPRYYILLKTCDRVELYYEAYNHENSLSETFLTLNHLFSLVSGLKSPLLGEIYIFHQVKKAYEDAVRQGKVNKMLHLVFQKAFHVGKKVRSETGISKGAPSHSLAVYKIVKEKFSSLDSLSVAIIGVNKINEDLMKYFCKSGVKQIFLGNRTFEKAKEFSEKYNALAFRLDKLREIIKSVDVLITATSAPHFIVRKEDIETNKNLLIFDISVPRNVDPRVKEYKNISYIDIEEVEKIVSLSLMDRERESKKAEKIVTEEAEKFLKNIRREIYGEYTSSHCDLI